MVQENNTFLGGELVGIGKVRANGEIEYRELEKPVHNRITSVGLDHLFRYGGTDNSSSWYQFMGTLWAGLYYSQYYPSMGKRAGALEFMSFGSGTTATSFSDTNLVNGIGVFTNTKLTSTATNQTLNGVKVNSFGNFSFIISHKSDAVSARTTVNEIGWFGGYGSDLSTTAGTKVLFARVVLPSSITLEAGESLLTTYKLTETNSNITETTGNDFFGLKDSNGNTLQYAQKLYRYYNTNSTTGMITNEDLSEPLIKKDGSNGFNWVSDRTLFVPAFVDGSEDTTLHSQIFHYSTDSSYTFPAEGTNEYNVNDCYLSTIDPSYFTVTNSSYNGVGSTNKYRDKNFVIGAYCPNMQDNPTAYTDIYYININGMAYRFGYYDNGVWVPQAWRKYANEQVTFTFRTRYSTEDTTMS